MSEMSFWDYLTLAVALGVIAVYVIVRIRGMLNPDNSGCNGCSMHNNPSHCSPNIKGTMGSCPTKSSSTESAIKWDRR
ncbi:MAG: hypothetical protein GQ470_01150 [Gammaproteobacteria bacterium]|nr:hypothetical protein [Gammaproteobacteria bacterium]